MAKVFVRAGFPFNYDADKASDDAGLAPGGPSLAKQSFAEEVDINTIVRRFGLTGQLPDNVRVPQYGDFSEVTDYHSAMLQVRAAQEAFMELPAHVRSRFHNDPGELVDFVSDEANRAEAEKLGLVVAKATPAPAVAPGAAVAAPGAVPGEVVAPK